MISIIKELRSTSSTNEKQQILKNNPEIKNTLFYTYNPRFKYNIRQIPEYGNGSRNDSIEVSLKKLDKLISGEYTGNAGIAYLKDVLESAIQPEVIELIIQRDLKSGINRSLINKVYTDLIPEEPYQGCMSYNEKLARELLEKDTISQIKADGQYCNAVCLRDELVMKSRAGEKYYLSGPLVEDLKNLFIKDVVLNGELVIPGIDRATANGIIRAIITINEKYHDCTLTDKEVFAFKKKYGHLPAYFEEKMKYIVWDIVPYEDYLKGLCEISYRTRLENLDLVLTDNIVKVEGRKVKDYADAIAYFKEALENKEEGTVIKSLDAYWEDGKHKHQLKMKVELELDLEIYDFNEGTKGTKYEGTLGSLEVRTRDGLLSSACGGLKEKSGIREEIWNNKEKYRGKIVTVKCNGISTNKQGGTSLLYCNFLYIRDDKLVADSIEECKANEQMKLGLI